ncbi:MAG: hypothetical protein OXO52_12890 [Rhodospirillales bacterium]|nr:hypothetical protein [Rhodospirillales bacterium]MDE0379951.1 hypothetical protein [Rhodospirillales bacterium]
MLNLQGGRLLRVFDLLHGMEKIAKGDPTAAHGNGTFRAGLDLNVKILIEQLEILNAPVSIKKARTLLMYLSAPKEKLDPPGFVKLVSETLEELRERIKDELDDRTLYYLEPKQAELLLAGPDSFGNEVLDTFPKASTDISEAVACLAWGRYTACVFHLMRAMEFALHIVGEKLDVAIVDKNGEFLTWGKIIGNMGGAIKALNDEDEKRNWSEVHALLYHVKQCWRNDTMHPKRTYTQEEAIAVFEAVRSFLRSLSDRVFEA